MTTNSSRPLLFFGLLVGVTATVAVILFNRTSNSGDTASPDSERGAKSRDLASHETSSLSKLEVVTEPAGATVLINGRLVGATPVVWDGMPRGRYGVRLEKEGCKPVNRDIDLSENALVINEKMQALPTGTLIVEIEPAGAEVLLDGELLGHTPLKRERMPSGVFELLVRRTNFESYSRRISIEPGGVALYSGFELKDKIFAMLDGMVKAEPQRVAHYIDLGHYLFINNKQDKAADVFTEGMEIMQTPLDFDGAGYAGKQNMTSDEMLLEQRLRKEDESRFLKEVDKHRNWPRVDTKEFRKRMDLAQDLVARKNINSWTWAERSGQTQMKSRNFGAAAKTFSDHIAAAPQSPDLPKAYMSLLEVYLMQRDTAQASALFETFYGKYAAVPGELRQCGIKLASFNDRMVTQKDKDRVLVLAEKALRRSIELPAAEPAKAESLYELGAVLLYQNRPTEAVAVLTQCIDKTPAGALNDERSLRLADALRKSGQLAEAKAIFTRLSKSDRSNVKDGAKTGLIYVETDEAKKK
jgi:tetratricopeptide (TPR) repeat protein